VAHEGWSHAVKSARTRVKRTPWLRGALFLAQNGVHAVGGRPLAAAADEVVDSGPARGLTAMVRVKDEARFLPEWLAHHTNIGFEHVVLYDNNSSDDLAGAVAPFVERGLVTVVPWSTVPASPGAHIDFLRRFGPTSEWTAFFDADEFLVERRPGDLAQVLSAARGPAVAVNWRYYGSSGHETIPRGLVTERFDRADGSHNHHVKVIVRPRQVVAYRNSHNLYYRWGRLARTADGRRVFGSFVDPPEDPPLVLNHYVYRSREDYERKATHGFVDARSAKDRHRQTDHAAHEFANHNDVHAPLPPWTLAATGRLLEALGYPDELFRAHDGAAGAAAGSSTR
jgi:Glycosyltransferase family 92